MEQDKLYDKFILEISSLIMLNRDRLKNKHINLFFDDGRFWGDITKYSFVDILSRAQIDGDVIDPVHYLSGDQFLELVIENEDELTDEEYDEFIDNLLKDIRDLLSEEVPEELFLNWYEFTKL